MSASTAPRRTALSLSCNALNLPFATPDRVVSSLFDSVNLLHDASYSPNLASLATIAAACSLVNLSRVSEWSASIFAFSISNASYFFFSSLKKSVSSICPFVIANFSSHSFINFSQSLSFSSHVFFTSYNSSEILFVLSSVFSSAIFPNLRSNSNACSSTVFSNSNVFSSNICSAFFVFSSAISACAVRSCNKTFVRS